MSNFIQTLFNFGKPIVEVVKSVVGVAGQVGDILSGVRDTLNPGLDEFLDGDKERIEHALEIVRRMQRTMDPDIPDMHLVQMPSSPLTFASWFEGQVTPIIHKWSEWMNDNFWRPYTVIRLTVDENAPKKIAEDTNGDKYPVDFGKINSVAATDVVVQTSADQLAETLTAVTKNFPLTLGKIDNALSKGDELKRTYLEKRIMNVFEEAFSTILVKLGVDQAIAPFNLKVPNDTSARWEWSREDTSFTSQYVVQSSNPTTYATNGGTGITWDSDSRGLVFGNLATPFALNISDPAPGYSDGNHQIEIQTVYQEQGQALPLLDPKAIDPSNKLPKESLWEWFNTMMVDVEVEWSACSVAVGGYIQLLVFVHDGTKQYKEVITVFKTSTNDTVTRKGIKVPMANKAKVWFRLKATTVTAFTGNCVSTKIAMVNPVGYFRIGSTVPYDKVTYKTVANQSYQSLANNTVTFFDLFGTLIDSPIDDPIASVPSMWIDHVGQYGNIINTLIPLIYAYGQIVSPPLDFDRTLQAATGNENFTLTSLIPVQQWPLATSAWSGLTSLQKEKVMCILHDLFVNYAELIVHDKSAYAAFKSVVGVL